MPLMRDLIIRSFLLLAVTIIATMIVNQTIRSTGMTAQASTTADPKPLLNEWEGPDGGVPPFDRVKIEYFKPALEEAMSQNLAEIDKIASDNSAPTFDNTIVAMERAGQTLDRVTTVYGVWS